MQEMFGFKSNNIRKQRKTPTNTTKVKSTTVLFIAIVTITIASFSIYSYVDDIDDDTPVIHVSKESMNPIEPQTKLTILKPEKNIKTMEENKNNNNNNNSNNKNKNNRRDWHDDPRMYGGMSNPSFDKSKYHDPNNNNNNNNNNNEDIIEVIVGYCCHDPERFNSQICDPQPWVVDIAEGTFPINLGYKIYFQQCNQRGLAPAWMIDNTYKILNVSYQEQISNILNIRKNIINNNETLLKQIDSHIHLNDEIDNAKSQHNEKYHHLNENQFENDNNNNDNDNDNSYHWSLDVNTFPIWRKPDIMFCQGYFYHPTVTNQLIINDDNSENVIKFDNQFRNDENNNKLAMVKHVSTILKHKDRSFLTSYNTEFWGGGRCQRYDAVFESARGRPYHGCFGIYVPPAYFFERERMHNNTKELIKPLSLFEQNPRYKQEYIDNILSFKSRFAFFLVRDCMKTHYWQDAMIRVLLFDTLKSSMPHKSVEALGGCRRDSKRYQEIGQNYCPKNQIDGAYLRKQYNCKGYGWTDGVVQMAKPYKFMIAFENTRLPGYSTEKIFNAFYANAIPIYFGDYTITNYLNPDSFIHCDIPEEKIEIIRQFDKHGAPNKLEQQISEVIIDNIQECINKIKMVDENDELYYKMLTAPIFINNSVDNTDMDSKLIGKKLRYALKLEQSYLIRDGQD